MLVVAVLAVVLALGSFGHTAWAFSLQGGSQSLNGGPAIDGSGAGNDILRDTSAPDDGWWQWGDRDGDDNDVPVATAGLQLGDDRLSSDDGTDLKFDLNGGAITGNAGTSGIDTHETYRDNAGDVILQNAASVTVGEILTWHTGDRDNSAGRIDISATGDVTIGDDASPGALDARGGKNGVTGSVTVNHNGAFFSGDIKTHWQGGGGGTTDPTGPAYFDGSTDTTINATDTFECGNIYTYSYDSYDDDGGNVTIQDYAGVHVRGDIDTHGSRADKSPGGSNGAEGGDVEITNIKGDIRIDGTLDLDADDHPGYAELQTTNSEIILGLESDPGAKTLDLAKLEYIEFDSAAGVSWIWLDIDRWTDGSDQIRVGNQGDVVYYSPVANPDLVLGGDNGVYALTGGGIPGTLQPVPSAIPEPGAAALLLLGGLLGLKRRRR
jgi:hypothetical protein